MMKAFVDAQTSVLKAAGFMEANEPGDIAIEVGDGFDKRPGEWAYVGESWQPHLPPSPPPGPPTLMAATFGISIANGDIDSIGGGYNMVGAIYLGAGQYMLFFLESPATADYFLLFSGGDGCAFSVAEKDPAYAIVEARTGGALTDPAAPFNIQVFRIP